MWYVTFLSSNPVSSLLEISFIQIVHINGKYPIFSLATVLLTLCFFTFSCSVFVSHLTCLV